MPTRPVGPAGEVAARAAAAAAAASIDTELVGASILLAVAAVGLAARMG